MATIAAVECAEGVVLAGDRRVLAGEAVAGTRRHVFDLDGAAAAAVGDDVDDFRRRLEAEVRAYRRDRGEPGVDTLARLAATVADRADVESIVAGRDDDGGTALRTVASGAVLADAVAAFGDGAPVALGRLEGAGADEASLEAAESLLREALSAAGERDPGTGDELDVVRLSDAADDGSG